MLALFQYRRGCYRGSAAACVGAARALSAAPGGDPGNEARRLFEQGQTAAAEPALQRACTMGDRWACALRDKVK
jgi:hypothetical protein